MKGMRCPFFMNAQNAAERLRKITGAVIPGYEARVWSDSKRVMFPYSSKRPV
jgi:hypothetical protein